MHYTFTFIYPQVDKLSLMWTLVLALDLFLYPTSHVMGQSTTCMNATTQLSSLAPVPMTWMLLSPANLDSVCSVCLYSTCHTCCVVCTEKSYHHPFWFISSRAMIVLYVYIAQIVVLFGWCQICVAFFHS